MVFRSKRRRLEEEIVKLKKEIERVEAENKAIKENAPHLNELLKIYHDFQTLGAGLMEIRRIHPDSVFLIKP